MALLLAVRLRGTLNVRSNASEAMKRMKLLRKFNATLLQDDKSTLGMLRAASAFVAWSRIDKEQLVSLLKARGMITDGKLRKMTDEEVKKFGYNSLDELADSLLQGKVKWSQLDWVKHTFNLAPPKGGFKRKLTRLYGAGGMLAENPELPQLVERML
ncbi:MAG: hypothetical protein QXE12_02415 [Conexivisphaerales archaeon]